MISASCEFCPRLVRRSVISVHVTGNKIKRWQAGVAGVGVGVKGMRELRSAVEL